MLFANKVFVVGRNNPERFISKVTAHYAEEMVLTHRAKPLRGGRVVKVIQLLDGGACIGGSNPYYVEVLEANPHLPMLKRIDENGAFVRW